MEKISKTYFNLVDKIFNKYPWSKGQYVGYLSIFNCRPRFLENKTFQIPYLIKNKKYLLSVTNFSDRRGKIINLTSGNEHSFRYELYRVKVKESKESDIILKVDNREFEVSVLTKKRMILL